MHGKLIYILPNLFTAGSIITGVMSIFASTSGNFTMAIALVVASLILDGMDGRIARLTNTTSKFGVEFDSLADLVAFGVAPAMLFYFTAGVHCGQFGTAVSAIFVAFGAIRLARFNVTTGTYEPNVFIGLPIPSAAIVLSFYVGLYDKYTFLSEWFLCFLAIVLSVLMVSNVRFPSFKKLNLSRTAQLKVLTILIFLVALIYLHPLECTTILFTAYLAYGIGRGVWNLFFARKIRYNQLLKARKERDKK